VPDELISTHENIPALLKRNHKWVKAKPQVGEIEKL